MTTWLVLAGVFWVLLWFTGYYVHRKALPGVLAVRWPRAVGLFFGGTRPDGTLIVGGIAIQLWGDLIGFTIGLRAVRIINGSQCVNIIVGGGLFIALWALFLLLRESRSHEKQLRLEIEKHEASMRQQKDRAASPIAFAEEVHPPRNGWYMAASVLVDGVLLFGSLWMLWIWNNMLVSKLVSGQLFGDILQLISSILFDVGMMLGVLLFMLMPLLFADIRLTAQEIQVFWLYGRRSMRWSDVTRIRIVERNTVLLFAGNKKLVVPLLFFKFPQEIMTEIAQRVPDGTLLIS